MEWPDDLPCPGCGKIIRWGMNTFYQSRTGSSGEESYQHYEADAWRECKGMFCSNCLESGNKKEEMENCYICEKEGCPDCFEYDRKLHAIHIDCREK